MTVPLLLARREPGFRQRLGRGGEARLAAKYCGFVFQRWNQTNQCFASSLVVACAFISTLKWESAIICKLSCLSGRGWGGACASNLNGTFIDLGLAGIVMLLVVASVADSPEDPWWILKNGPSWLESFRWLALPSSRRRRRGRDATWRAPVARRCFRGWSNNHLNNLHVIISLETSICSWKWLTMFVSCWNVGGWNDGKTVPAARQE